VASSGAEGERLPQQVEILHDPADDRRLHDAIRRRCRRRRDQLALALPPEDRVDRRPLSDWVLLAVYQALEEPPRPSRAELSHRRYHPTQLPLFTRAEVGGTSRDVPHQLSLLPELELAERIARSQALARDLWLEEVSAMLVDRGVRDLYVLHAGQLSAGTWEWFCRLACSASICLHLVVGGRPPRAPQRRALAECRVRETTATLRRRRPWWAMPGFRSRRQSQNVPQRMTLPRRSLRAPRGYDRAISAPKSHAPALHPLPVPAPLDGLGGRTPQAEVCPALSELARKELWERFRAAAGSLIADPTEPSFVSFLTPPQPSPEEMAARQERTLAAFAKLVARIGDRVQEFFPIPPPGGRAAGDGGREEDQER
jgi:hypothetical protein